jgi:aerobic carbon-monoxide dehydrogenase large subunit
MVDSPPAVREVGAHRKRVEDPKLVQGQGCYVDDLRLPGTVEVAFVRSAYAHARIRGVDLAAARSAPGVLAAWAGDEVKDRPRLPSRLKLDELKLSPLPALAHGMVTCVGYPVAVVVAENRYLARDAAELIDVDYEPLPAVTTAEEALASDAPLVWPDFGTNVAYHVVKEGGDVDGAFARNRSLSLRLAHSRLAQVPMEPRAILAAYDRQADLLTVWRSTQSPFLTRAQLSAVLGRPESSIRVIAPDVGGAFGSKSAVYPDELAVALLAMQLERPVRWVSTRMEDLQLTLQGRDQTNLVDVAFTNDGRLTGLKVRCLFNVGGVLLHPIAAPPLRVTDYATGAYRIPAYRCDALGVYTNTVPTGPYRGAGRPEAAYIAERAIEAVARELGRDPVDLRRQNFLRPDEFPYTTPVGTVYDSGDYARGLARALEVAGYAELKAEQQRVQAEGKELMGVGLATTIEVSGQGQEFGSIEVEADGSIIARTGSSSHGQGHETSFCQVVAERLGVPFEKVRLVHGDTAELPTGGGTGGSRSMVLGGSALAASAETVKARAVEIAASALEVSPADLVYTEGGVQVVGVPERRLSLAEIAQAAGDAGLAHADTFVAPGDAIPFGAIVAVVRIDRETGKVRLDRLIAVDDCGTVVNPLIVDGQVAGGLTQGIGEALYEKIVFGTDGQLLTSTLLEYAVPKAAMVPDYELDLVETKSPNNPLGAKGIGESGCVSAPPAITNAVLDALAPFGVQSLDMPLTSEKIWRALATTSS